jgi:putative SOS response-associated peptidase YedK
LDPANVNAEILRAFLCPAETDDMIAYPVSRAVNSSRTDAPMLVDPA